MRNPEYIFFVGAICIAIPLVGTLISACTTSDTERLEAATTSAQENLVTITPRPGVECYVVPGFSTLNPRVMSCVVLPAGVQ